MPMASGIHKSSPPLIVSRASLDSENTNGIVFIAFAVPIIAAVVGLAVAFAILRSLSSRSRLLARQEYAPVEGEAEEEGQLADQWDQEEGSFELQRPSLRPSDVGSQGGEHELASVRTPAGGTYEMTTATCSANLTSHSSIDSSTTAGPNPSASSLSSFPSAGFTEAPPSRRLYKKRRSTVTLFAWLASFLSPRPTTHPPPTGDAALEDPSDLPPSFASAHPESLTSQDLSILLAKKASRLRANAQLHRLLWDAGLLSGPPPEDVERVVERMRMREERRMRRREEWGP